MTASGKDTDKIRKRTAATAYTYDTTGRLTKAVETKGGTTTAGWSYCYDKAGNRTASSTGTGVPAACADAQHTYTYNDTGELTAYDAKSGFSYDGDGNETSAAGPTGTRTGEDWTPFTQLAAYTQSGATTTQTYAGADNTQRLTRDGATFAHLLAPAEIPVERARADLLLIAGGDDAMWPSLPFAEQLAARRPEFGTAVRLVARPDAGHRPRLPRAGVPALPVRRHTRGRRRLGRRRLAPPPRHAPREALTGPCQAVT